MAETWLKKLWYGPREIIEDVPYFVTRDNVEGRTHYHHHRDPRKNRFGAPYWAENINGVYPYIEAMDEGGLNLWVCPVSDAYLHAASVMLNVQGRLVTWDGAASKTERMDMWFGEVERDIFDFVCDAAWIDALQQLTKAPLSVLRFKGTHRDSHCDHEITKHNVRLVADVLNAYSSLKEARLESTPSPLSGSPPEGPGLGGNVMAKGPFQLHPDGSITDRESRLYLPPGAQISEIRLDRFVLRSDQAGCFVITDPNGLASAHRFRGGRWEEARSKTTG